MLKYIWGLLSLLKCLNGGNTMDIIGLIIEFLKQKEVITALEQDILDTYHEWSKKPFERDSTIRQIQKNNINHTDIFAGISSNPTVVMKPWSAASNEDVYSNLTSQLGALVEKELEVLKRGQ